MEIEYLPIGEVKLANESSEVSIRPLVEPVHPQVVSTGSEVAVDPSQGGSSVPVSNQRPVQPVSRRPVGNSTELLRPPAVEPGKSF